MNKKRPVNLALTTLAFPPMAIASILHRIAGVVIFLGLPFVLYLLDLSLRDQASFSDVALLLVNPYVKGGVWIFSSAFIYHMLAGIRHMLMDLGLGESLYHARMTALAVIILGTVSVACLGIWIW
ncbi:MAG: succinate dehydrogenase, cytochrome b556 subunit [Legionellaceae bacterium]|nr:succinate dehydrogenase, cytochrome b556 subunit [Legionellaceae bacterium]